MTAVTVVGLQRWNERTLGVVGSALAEDFLGNTVSRNPDMVMAGKVDLIDRTILLAPFVELEETVLVWYVWYTAENWIACIRQL